MNLDLGQVWSGFILGNWIQKGLIFGPVGVFLWRLGLELSLGLQVVQVVQHVFGALTDRLALFWRDALQVFDHQGCARVAGKAGLMLVQKIPIQRGHRAGVGAGARFWLIAATVAVVAHALDVGAAGNVGL